MSSIIPNTDPLMVISKNDPIPITPPYKKKDVLISRARQKATVASLGQVPFPAL